MALHFELKNVKDFQTKCFSLMGRINPKTEALIWTTMSVGMNKITEENYKEFHTRYTFANQLMGWVQDISLEDVQEHIGLWTNATERTWNQFTKIVIENWCRDNKFNPKKKMARA